MPLSSCRTNKLATRSTTTFELSKVVEISERQKNDDVIHNKITKIPIVALAAMEE